MFYYLLKSSVCLAIFMLFYKLCLEKTSAHHFKRFYLLAIIFLSAIIPFITFTTYVEVANDLSYPSTESPIPLEVEEPSFWETHSQTLIWSIYLLGVAIFMFRFIKNISKIFKTIKTNPKYKNKSFINVLVMDLLHPHTFFNYIFVNRSKFENHQIPTEVLIHEQTHAKQKHGFDILFIELLQIIFWFNPILFFLKKDIKLNHEFLADQSVINQGYSTKYYQQLLLAYSSNATYNPLANAINYSFIKKRFTIMKTKTSKRILWLRSIIILPLLASLIYGFSEKVTEKIVVKNNLDIKTNQDLLPKIQLYNQLNEKKLEAEKKLQKSNIKDSTELKFIKQRLDLTQKDIESSIHMDYESAKKRLKELQSRIKANTSEKNLKQPAKKETLPIFLNQNNIQQKATPEEIAEYNRTINRLNSHPENKRIIKQKDFNRLQYIHDKMDSTQKTNAKSLPKLPPPPPFSKDEIKLLRSRGNDSIKN